MITLLSVQAVMSVSIIKAVVLFVALVAWGRWATVLDKDAELFYLKRRAFNALTLASGGIGLLLWMVIPFYIVGLLAFLMLAGGAAVAYVMLRNPNVPEDERWSLSPDSLGKMFSGNRTKADKKRDTHLKFISMASQSSAHFKAVPETDDPDYEQHLLLDELLNTAMQRRAHRLDIAIGSNEAIVQVSIDGSPYRLDNMPQEQALKVLKYLKTECGLDTDELRKKQVGTIKADIGTHGVHELQVTAAGSTRGLTLAIDVDFSKQRTIPFDNLGMLEPQIDQIKPVIAETSGVVLVASPARNGRTTTLYSLLDEHDPYLQDIHSLEENIEAKLEGVTQHRVEEGEWSRMVRSTMLKDPTVVMVGQVPDAETAKEVVAGAKEGKRIYAGIPANDTFGALKTWASAVKSVPDVADTLQAIICQRLVRKLCPICRQPYQPEAAALKKLNLPSDKITQLYKASGKIISDKREQTCETCQGLGYLGRTAAFEVMVLDNETRELLRAGDMNGLRNALRKKKMMLMQEAALVKVINGDAGISEVMRALGGDK